MSKSSSSIEFPTRCTVKLASFSGLRARQSAAVEAPPDLNEQDSSRFSVRDLETISISAPMWDG